MLTKPHRPTENESSTEREEGEFNPLLLQLSAAVVRPFGRRLDVASAVSVGKFSYIQIGEFNCPKQYLFT